MNALLTFCLQVEEPSVSEALTIVAGHVRASLPSFCTLQFIPYDELDTLPVFLSKRRCICIVSTDCYKGLLCAGVDLLTMYDVRRKRASCQRL
jgi:hypothetical protein